MTAEHAASQYPTARPEPSTRELREIPETDAERAALPLQSAGHDGVKS